MIIFRLGTALALVFLVIQCPADAWAQRQRGRSPDVWSFLAKKYDKNNDGKLSKSEYDRADNFAKFDINEDGVLTKEDWSGARSRNGNRTKRTSSAAPVAGDSAPDFELTSITNSDEKVRLSNFAGKKPVALIFGSCT